MFEQKEVVRRGNPCKFEKYVIRSVYSEWVYKQNLVSLHALMPYLTIFFLYNLYESK